LCENNPTLEAAKLGPAPYKVKIEFVKTHGLLYAKEQGTTLGFNNKKQ
jgi:hypothetical protein